MKKTPPSAPFSLPLPKHYSKSRELRNVAERQRRDKMNYYVSELATLVPFVSGNEKKVDKTSILRLSASYLRLHSILNKSKNELATLPSALIGGETLRNLLDSIGGFLLVITNSGKIVFASEAIEDTFGYNQADVLGQSFFSLIHEDDVQLVLDQLRSKDTPRRSFYCRLMEKSVSRNDKSRYQIIHVMGHMKKFSDSEYANSSSPGTPSEEDDGRTSPDVRKVYEHQQLEKQNSIHCKQKRGRGRGRKRGSSTKEKYWSLEEGSCQSQLTDFHSVEDSGGASTLNSDSEILVAFVKVVRDRHVTQISWVESLRDEYITRHRLDGSIAYVDHRISFVTGLMPEEVLGKSAFTYMHPDDVCWSILAQKQMLGNSQGQGMVTYRLVGRDGSHVVLRSRGFLEVNKDTGKIDSFICINTVLSVTAGKSEIRNQRKTLQTLLRGSSTDDIVESIASGLPSELKSLLCTNQLYIENFISHVREAVFTREDDSPGSIFPLEESEFSRKDPPDVPLDSSCEDSDYYKINHTKRRCSKDNYISSKSLRRSLGDHSSSEINDTLKNASSENNREALSNSDVFQCYANSNFDHSNSKDFSSLKISDDSGASLSESSHSSASESHGKEGDQLSESEISKSLDPNLENSFLSPSNSDSSQKISVRKTRNFEGNCIKTQSLSVPVFHLQNPVFNGKSSLTDYPKKNPSMESEFSGSPLFNQSDTKPQFINDPLKQVFQSRFQPSHLQKENWGYPTLKTSCPSSSSILDSHLSDNGTRKEEDKPFNVSANEKTRPISVLEEAPFLERLSTRSHMPSPDSCNGDILRNDSK